MNVTLIYPLLSRRRSQVDENKQFWPPLGLAYIASVLERGAHKVQIIDRDLLLRKNEMDFDKVDAATAALIKDFDTGVVGISATTPNMSDVGHISQFIKKSCGDVPIVLGGPHPSGEPILSMEENSAVDIVAKGEGEFTMLDIADGLPPDNIAGINFRKDGRIISNAMRDSISDIDALPMPARHLLDMKFYVRPSRFTSRNLSLKTTSIFTARGCPYRCNFCAGPLVFNGKVRFHSPGRVIAEIEELVSAYGVEALYFAEDMFLSSKKRAEELLGLFIEKGINKRIRWMAQAKASIITEELLELMKDAGCVGIEYGFESGSQRVLDLMNKRLDIAESLRAAALTRKARLRFQANIIVGYPGERDDDFKKTVEFIKKVGPNMVGFNLFMPLPGTPSYDKLKREGRQLPKWDDIGDPEAPQMNFADMPRETFERLYLETRLKVILPMNLRAFLSDNIRNPLRLVRIALTQFSGVMVKTFRSFLKLRTLKRAPNAK
jgi:anaerobic magnesium-protoporphyrin IX monomethyl ester cyclase